MSYTPNILATGGVSAAATADINFANFFSQYNYIKIQIYGLRPATNNVTLQLLVSTDGTTFDNGAGTYQWVFDVSVSGNLGSGVASTSDTSASVSTSVGNTAGQQGVGEIVVWNPSNAALHPVITWNMSIPINAGLLAIINGSCERLTSQVTKAIRLLMSSGNITCNWVILGIK